ncbi:phosphate acetyltransferase [Spirulina subsalsa]|uniref:phosphate acetyltransferase n=1 Tax=Spirulina subsalsa TaxID=54311 RepID=UPI0002FBABD5|nr:phosphate acetyltransferase [Spirulina subsalsa]
MTHSLYISINESKSGKSLIALGIIELILRKTTKVGFFRPIIGSHHPEEADKDIKLILRHFRLNQTYEESYGVSFQEMGDLGRNGNIENVLEKIISRYKNLEQKCDFILCEGSDYLGQSTAFEFNINRTIAKTLNCPVLIIGNAYQKTIDEAINSVDLSFNAYQEEECQVVGILLNKANPRALKEFQDHLEAKYDPEKYLLGVIPFSNRLNSPRVRDIVAQLKAEVIWGGDKLDNVVSSYIVAAMQVQHAITHFVDDALVITPGDRGDIIIGALQAHQSVNYPRLAGIVLSTGFRPELPVMQLIEGLSDSLPILLVEENTYETATQLNTAVYPSITASDHEKISLSLRQFNRHVNLAQLEKQISTLRSHGITPKMFIYNRVEQAKALHKHIVLPEGNEPRILKAAAWLVNQDIVDLTLLGQREEIAQIIKQQGIHLDLDKVQIINPLESEKLGEYIQIFYDLRKHKGVTLESARDCVLDVSYFGTMMVYQGEADGMVSGALHTTQHTIRPALQIIKTKPNYAIVSSVFLMCLSDRVLVYGDCAVNPNPNAEQLAEIALSSAETAESFGIEPKVALLSYSSGTSGQGEAVEKVRRAAEIAKQRRPDLKLEGPIQYDAAVDAEVAAQKLPNSEVAGQATVLVFPDLNTGNNTYKAVQRETGAIAIGPILQGLKKPVNDLSRGCTVPDIINTVVITAIQS